MRTNWFIVSDGGKSTGTQHSSRPTRMSWVRLGDADVIGDNPNINLPEAFFQHRLDLLKECRILGCVFHVNEQTDIFIRMGLTLMNPKSLKRFGQIRRGSKLGD